MADKFIAAHEGGWRNRKHAQQWEATLRKHAAPLRDKPVDEINTGHVLACLSPIWSVVPETASRVRARIEAVIASAAVAGHIPEDRPNPARWANWLDLMLPNPRKVGKPRGNHKALDYRDLPAFMARLTGTDTVPARALQFTILTCARTGEALGMRWEEVSFDKAVWTVPAWRMKMGKPHDVPLSDAALDILRSQEAARGKNPFIFAGRPQRPLSAMAMSMLLRRMKIEATVHGMRSAARSWMADQGVAFELAEAALAHMVGNAVVRAYQRSSMLERRRPVLAAWAAFVTGEADDNVVPLRRGASQ